MRRLPFRIDIGHYSYNLNLFLSKIIMKRLQRIIGIDPGSRVVGFAVIEAKILCPRTPRDYRVIEAGVMQAKLQQTLPERLGALHDALYSLIVDIEPDVCTIEKAFYGVNASSALKLGEARGALIAAIRRFGSPIYEITPAQVKRLVGGHGAASKDDVAHGLKALLGFNRGALPADASDAVAVALASTMLFSFQETRRPVAEVRLEHSLS
jgi:crossover junction endodeoxyribonuclease RuvC